VSPAPGVPADDIGVLITGVGSGSTGEQVYKALRLGRRKYRLAVTNVNREQSAVAGDACSIGLPPAGHPEYLGALATAANDFGAKFIVPGSDPELRSINAGAGELAALTAAIPLANNLHTVRTCWDKEATARAVAAAGFTTPATIEFDEASQAAEAVEKGGFEYPIIVKPKDLGGGSAHVYIAQDAQELEFFTGYILRQGARVVLQTYVGDSESEYTVGVMHFPDGTLGGSFALRRDLTSLLSTRFRIPNRTRRAELGSWLVVSSGFSQGYTDDYADIRRAAEGIAGALKSTGPLNLQGRLVEGTLVLFEINPRFSGTEAIRAMAGWNGPEALIDWHLGVEPSLGRYRPRRARFIRSLTEFVASRP
jgi:carbamoyl-phosphate synthase large subunit